MQLRYLENVELYKATKVKQPNGVKINVYTKIDDYVVQKQEITDEASISIYGATINKMYRISSPRKVLETYLKPKINDRQDNISLYFIKYNNVLYKINAVRENWIDIEYTEEMITESI